MPLAAPDSTDPNYPELVHDESSDEEGGGRYTLHSS